jgi:hypothetical protein
MALLLGTLPSVAEAQSSRGNGVSSGAGSGVGGFSARSHSGVNRGGTTTGSLPSSRAGSPMTSSPGYGMSGYYKNTIGTVPPGTRATEMGRR